MAEDNGLRRRSVVAAAAIMKFQCVCVCVNLS